MDDEFQQIVMAAAQGVLHLVVMDGRWLDLAESLVPVGTMSGKQLEIAAEEANAEVNKIALLAARL
jgi:hypothetical protein